MATILSSISSAAPGGFLLKGAGAEIRLGQVDGVIPLSTAGSATLAVAEVDIWPENAVLVLPALTGSALEIVSTDPADTAAGTGAQEVTVTLLDTAFVRSTQAVATAGAVAAPVPGGPYVMCESSFVSATGSGRTNAGIVRTRIAAAGAVQNHIPLGGLRSQQTFFGVAAKEQAVIIALGAMRNNATAAMVRVREDGLAGLGVSIDLNLGLFNELDERFQNGILVTSSNRIRVTAQFVAGAANGISGIVGGVRVANFLTA